jgi:hypothetical protein
MRAGRTAKAAAVLGLSAAAGCGFGAGSQSRGVATLTVTRDYGTHRMVRAAAADPASSETVIRLLDDHADVGTRYGGKFVQSIDGVAGSDAGGRRSDWFFYVNGLESPTGAADVAVHGGDRVWWDYRDWTVAMRVPAVVGQWPEPFAQAAVDARKRLPVRVECATAERTCREVAGRLGRTGALVTVRSYRAGADSSDLRVLVGAFRRIGGDPAVRAIYGGPAESGVFAEFGQPGLDLLDPTGNVVRRLGRGAGLIAAVRRGDDPPTWLVTGTNNAGSHAAARALDSRDLRDRYAVAALPSGTRATHVVPLPVGAGR